MHAGPGWQHQPVEDEPPYHQLVGNGCIYPASVPTLGNQLSAAQLTWKAYLQDMGNVPSRDNTVMTKQGPACDHPPIGKPDPTEGAVPADITFDEGSNDTACCGETSGKSPSHPNSAEPGMGGPGGGRVGAVVLSPLIRPGTVSTVDYNHYSTLRTIEDIFRLSHLGDAAMPRVKPFGRDVFGS